MTHSPPARPRILFRPDLTPGAGLGHFARCAALADAIDAMGGRVRFVVEPDAVELVRRRGYDAVAASAPIEGDPLGVLGFEDDPASLIVIDSYRLDREALRRIGARYPSVVVLDDLAECYAPADLVVNGAAHAPELDYDEAAVGALLAGPEFMLLNPRFVRADARRQPEQVQDVLVAVGGGDPLDLMAPVLATARDALMDDVRLHAVIGPGFPEHWSTAPEIDRWDARGVTLHLRPTDLLGLMEQADLAVTAAGLILYELAAVGVPTVAFSMADNQAPQLETLARLAVVRSVGDARRGGFRDRLDEQVKAVATDYGERRRMAEEARQIVDGRGAERVARRVLALARPSGARSGSRP